MSSFANSFTHSLDESLPAGSTRSFDDDYLGHDSRLPSQPFDDSFTASVTDSPIFNSSSYGAGDDVFATQDISETASPALIYVSGGDFSPFSPGINGKAFDGDFSGPDGPLLPPPTDMESEIGFALREWRRQNAIHLEEKERQEKQVLNQIIDEADEYKIEFYRRRKTACENNKNSNREKEKLFLANHEKFHVEADKNYWKAIAELVPKEVPAKEKKRGKKDQDKKPSIAVIQGPKPGKPTDLSRMRHILLKLKHNTPPHLKPSPTPVSVTAKDAKTSGPATASTAPAAAVATPQAVSVAVA